MHFIVMAIGSDGDINPMLGIASELKKRGHDIDFFANGYFAKKIADLGLNHVYLGEEDQYLEIVKDARLWDPRLCFQTVWNALKVYLLDQYQLIEEKVIPEKTALVGTTLAFSTRLAQEKLGLKLSTVHLSPSVILSSKEPPYMPGLKLPDWLPYGLRKLIMASIDRYALDGIMKTDLNIARSSLELPPVERIMSQWMHSPDQVVLAFPQWFAEAQSDWPKNSIHTGFPIYNSPEGMSISNPVLDFIKAGDKPIIFTAGSAMAHSKEFFEMAVGTSNALGRRAILVNKFDPDIGNLFSDSIVHSKYEPFDLIFKEAAAVVHHGGIGTSAHCLASAVPQLVVPFAHDQFDNAHRLKKLRVGDYAQSMSVKEWSTKVSSLINSVDIKKNCHAMANLIQQNEGGCQKAADAIESLGS